MGVIKRGILGGFSQKVANVVGSSWKGIAVIKSLPLSVANPQTAGQVAQRTKMSALVEFAKMILGSSIKPLLDRFQTGMSGFNRWVQLNMPNVNGAGVITYNALITSEGNLQGAVTVVGNRAVAQIDFVYSDDTGTGSALGTDKVFITVVNVVTGIADSFDTGSTRFGGAASVVPTAYNQADGYTCILSFLSANGNKVSNSQNFPAA